MTDRGLEVVKKLISQEPDGELRNELLKEVEGLKAANEPQIHLWEKEAQAVIKKEIKDPVVRAAIWHHHGRELIAES